MPVHVLKGRTRKQGPGVDRVVRCPTPDVKTRRRREGAKKTKKKPQWPVNPEGRATKSAPPRSQLFAAPR